MKWVEAFIELPARFVSVCFRCMVEAGLIWIDAG
jgi:hypothetical protein